MLKEIFEINEKERGRNVSEDPKEVVKSVMGALKVVFVTIILILFSIGVMTFCARAGWLIANNIFGG